MRLCWFNDDRLGLVEDRRVLDVTAALDVLPPPRYPARPGDLLIAHLGAVRERIAAVRPGAASVPLADVVFRSPVANPTKIIGVPANYLKHVEEADADRETFTARYRGSIEEQGLFLKATSALAGFGEGVRVRFPDRSNHHEMELGVVIGRKAARVGVAEAMDCIAGYTIALDFVVRGSEDRSMRKSIDSYAVVGPWLTTADEVPSPQALSFRLSVNGAVRQASNTAHMIMPIARQIAWASQFYTLWPGDIIMTGTCEGVGPIAPGDVIDCEIDGVASGRLEVGTAG